MVSSPPWRDGRLRALFGGDDSLGDTRVGSTLGGLDSPAVGGYDGLGDAIDDSKLEGRGMSVVGGCLTNSTMLEETLWIS